MNRYLHTMVRITNPERSRAFYEALGMELRRDMDIVRDGVKEATNYFFGYQGQDEELELTFNHDGRTYELGTGYGHVALGVDDLDGTLAGLAELGIEPERAPYTVRDGGSRLCFLRDPDRSSCFTSSSGGWRLTTPSGVFGERSESPVREMQVAPQRVQPDDGDGG